MMTASPGTIPFSFSAEILTARSFLMRSATSFRRRSSFSSSSPRAFDFRAAAKLHAGIGKDTATHDGGTATTATAVKFHVLETGITDGIEGGNGVPKGDVGARANTDDGRDGVLDAVGEKEVGKGSAGGGSDGHFNVDPLIDVGAFILGAIGDRDTVFIADVGINGEGVGGCIGDGGLAGHLHGAGRLG